MKAQENLQSRIIGLRSINLSTRVFSGLLLLIAFIGLGLLFTPTWLVSVPLYLIAVFGLFMVNRDLHPDTRNKLFESVFAFSSILLSVLLLTGVLLWLWVNFVWRTHDTLQVSTPIETPSNEITITLDHSRTIMADGEPASFTLAAHNRSNNPQTLQVTVTKPEELLFPTHPLTESLDLTIPLQPYRQANRSFQLRNRQNFMDSRTEVQLNLCVGMEPEQHSDCTPVPIIVEGQQGWRIRSFINSTIDQSSPLILLITFLVPGIGILLNQYMHRRDEEKKRREEEDKAALASKIDDLVKQFCENLRYKDRQRAEASLKDLRSQVNNNKNSPHIKTLDKVETLYRLISLSEELCKPDTETNVLEMLRNTREWPDECIIAYMMARENLKGLKLTAEERESVLKLFYQARYDLPIDEAQPGVYDMYSEYESSAGAAPLLMATPDPFDSARESSEEHSPFAGERAEDETNTLFTKQAYWPHPLFIKILSEDNQPRGTYIVSGHRGSGRTAMAMALTSPLYYPLNEPILALYLRGSHSINEMEALFTVRLLDIIKYNPTHLSHLNSDERALLCQLLAVTIGVDYARVIIKQAKAEISNLPWNQLTTAEARSEQKENWRSLAETQLGLLYRAMSSLSSSSDTIGTAVLWPNTISTCAKALGLKEVLLALDLSNNPEEMEWATNHIVPNLRLWHSRGLRVVLFLPQKEATGPWPEYGVVRHENLRWETKMLREFAEWRYEKLTSSNIDWHLDERGLTLEEIILEGKEWGTYSPRQFMKVWRSTIKEKINTNPAIVEEDNGVSDVPDV